MTRLIRYRLTPHWALAFLLAIYPLGAGGASAVGTGASSISADRVIRYLDQSIDWYRRVTALEQTPVNSQELLYRESARENARKSLKLAFDFARAQAAIVEGQPKQTPNAAPAASSTARLQQAAAAADARMTELKSELNESYRTTKVPADAARQSKLAAQLDLATAQRDVLSQYAGFMLNTAAGGGESLSDKIDQLQETVPEIKATASGSGDAPKAPAAAEPQQFHSESAGVLTLVSELFTLTGRLNELSQLKNQAIELQKSCDQMRLPIRTEILEDLRRANSLGATTEQSNDTERLQSERRDIESLTSDFKLTSSAGIPLGEESVLLASAAQSLSTWHESLAGQYEAAGRSLLFRTIATAVLFLLLITLSELWRRATFRYISDPRRRRQLMLVRRIVVGSIVVFIIIGSVVTEFGSLATFAGLITAGIAVALQTVILSGVAYFFFIGRFGVRVGDRVTVSGITGDVVEIGLFRLYLMELAGPITDLHSTGRMIVFSNAVLFQPSAFYKQLPGAEYVWHEIALTLSPETDHALAEQRLMGAVESVFAQYRDAIDEQHETANRILHLPLESPRPQVRLRFVDPGVEMVIRYPVELLGASKIEDQITRKVLEAIQQEPKLKMVVSGTPKIQSAA